MSVISWGKNLLEFTPSVDGAPAADAKWTAIDTPKLDSTKITTTAGTEVTAQEEGGKVVDYRIGASSATLEWDSFVKKGQPRPFTDDDGVIGGEWALRNTPEDPDCDGFQIDRSVIHVEESYSTADGILLHYVAKVLKPKEGKSIKPYVAGKAAGA